MLRRSKTRVLALSALIMLGPCFPIMLFGQARDKVPKERSIDLYIDINAPVEKVWQQWTTAKGIQSFFAPASKLELRPLGSFDIYFTPDAPVGQRGAEGNFILAIQQNEMLTFTWDAPNDWPEIRRQRTFITLRFLSLSPSKTRLTFSQTGWGTTDEWSEVHRYFETAWAKVVLPNLKYSLEVGPLDWRDFPNRLPKGLPPAKSLPKTKFRD